MSTFGGSTALSGNVSLRVFKRAGIVPAKELNVREIFKYAFPHFGLSREVFLWRVRNIPNILRGMWRILAARTIGINNTYGVLSLQLMRGDGSIVPYGIASMRVVTTAGVNFVVDAFQNTTEVETMKYHGFGTGNTAENVADTALITELTTQYATDNVRPTGTTTEGGSANIYRSVATLSPDTGGTIAIVEHGIFSATSAGTLLDRSVFSAVNLVAGSDSLTATYDLTFSAGS
jgi:hypothetical protein